MEQRPDQEAGEATPGADPNQGSSKEGDDVVTTTSASSSNSDLPGALLPDGERQEAGRRQSRPFTGLKLFGRRCYAGITILRSLV
ncbi:hypothetical protein UPYG_G00081020 [Umbra pygmaea]|uniref:Uncharacterized protein n=1 Tax=Umbra pygmaea TaxID=75934 RepID=A0ABD0XDN5_UMBPY